MFGHAVWKGSTFIFSDFPFVNNKKNSTLNFTRITGYFTPNFISSSVILHIALLNWVQLHEGSSKVYF